MPIIIPSSQYRAPNVRIITYRDIDNVPIDEHQLVYLKNIFRQYKGQYIEIAKKHLDDDRSKFITDTQSTNVPKRGFNSWWSNFTQFLFPDSDKWIFDESYNPMGAPSNQAQLIIMSADKVDKSNYQQFFLDSAGASHCVFTPMMNWCVDCSINSNTESTRKKYIARANKIENLIEYYNDGVPEKDFPEICNQLQIGIEIDMPSSVLDKNTKYIKYRSQKKPIKTFKFINTRINHIELNEITNKENYDEISQDELKKIFDNTHDFKLWKGDRDGQLYQINTLTKVYKLSDKEGYIKVINDFNKLNKLSQFKIEHNSQKELSKFLLNNVNRLNSLLIDPKYQEGTDEYYTFREYLKGEVDEEDFNQEIFDYTNSLKNLNHIDLKSAFTKGNECSCYQGYLGKITDFRRCKKIMGLGIYMIYNIKNIPPLLQKLIVLHKNNAYPSPELEYYKSLGVEFDIWCGCWGSRTDITFTDDMFNKDEKGVKYYCKWYGCLMKLTKKDRYNFDCKDLEFAKLNNISDRCDIRYNQHKKTGIIEYKKDRCYHSSHIACFIHSYARISMIEQLLKFKDISQIKAVQVDGIFYTGDVEIGSLFVKKTGKSLQHIYGNEYIIDCENIKPKLPKNRIHNLVEVHTGPGGAGKTHNNLIDKGLIAPLYIAPSWKLARNKSQEYNIDCSVFHYLLTKDPEVFNQYLRKYNNLIFDEITMLNDEDKKLILKRFKHHKIIFCGDVGYQLPPIEGYEFSANGLPIFRHTKNHRCQCEKLSKILKYCRELIRKDFIDIDTRKTLIDVGFEIHKKENIDYSVEDLIIAKTHANKDYYTEKYNSLQKYLIKENTKDYSNGQIILGDKPEGIKSVLQHAFTIHSIQGETAHNKLFIDINKINNLRMIYTALSRSRTFEQIIIIE